MSHRHIIIEIGNMTPRKAKKSQNVAQVAVNLHSDYDSEYQNANLDDAPPSQPTRTNTELNLSVIQRHLPNATSILSIAPYAVVYIFSPISEQWEKSGIEGTLFVCQQSPNSSGVIRYSVVVLNRRGLDNFQLELLDSSDVETTDEYVILQGTGDEGAPKVYGLWIFSEPEPSSTAHAREENARLIWECALRAETGRGHAEQNQQVNGQVQEGVAELRNAHHLNQYPVPEQRLGQGSNPISQDAYHHTYGNHHHQPAENVANFLHSASQHTVPAYYAPPTMQVGQSRHPGDMLGELFRRAEQNYRAI